MKKIIWFLIIIWALACKNKVAVVSNIRPDNQFYTNGVSDSSKIDGSTSLRNKNIEVDLLKNDVVGERIDTMIRGVKIIIWRASEGQLKIRYRLRNEENTIQFNYFDYSDLLFPNEAIAVLNDEDNYTRKSNIYLSDDNILILPLIGMNNSLSVYLVNLNTAEVIGNDIRTAWYWVWVKESNLAMLTSMTPVNLSDSLYLYKLQKTNILSRELRSFKIDSIMIKDKIEDNIDSQFKVVRQLLK